MSYIPKVWQARQGTNLNKFTKSSETSTSVILQNAPDAVTIPGTAFTADAMNNIESAIQDTRGALSTFVSELTTGLTNPYTITTDGTYLYVTEYSTGKVKKIVISTGIASELTTGLTNPFGITTDGTYLYVTEINTGKVKKITTLAGDFIAPSAILPQTVTTANVTVTEDRFGNILLSGALTGNRDVILPSTVRVYKVINNCTGSYCITVKTADGTGYDSYPGDRIELYCDGTNVDICGGEPADILGVERKTARGTYKKKISVGVLPSAGSTNTPHGISGTFSIADGGIRGSAKSGVVELTLPLPSSIPSYAIDVIRNGVNIQVSTGTDRTLYMGTVTLEYTKAQS